MAHVIDGDTVVLATNEKVRLLGINAPEKKYKNRSAQPYALEALLAMRELVEGKEVNLVEGRQQSDTYGRTLGYLELLNGDDAQEILLARGYAFAVAFPPDIDRLEHYLEAESKARRNKLGIWQNHYYDPVDTDRRTWINPGFGLFKGTIHRIGESGKNLLIELGKTMMVTIRLQDWNSFWHGDPARLEGKVIATRGWVNRGKGKNFLRVRHPSMMQVLQ